MVARVIEPAWPSPPLRLGLVCLSLVVLALLLYRAQRPLTRPSLFVQTERAKPGYFRVGPTTTSNKDRRAFHRSDGEHERVRDWLLRQPGAPLYLTGDSGTGKSSLLQAFVVPALRDAGWTGIVRYTGDPEAAATPRTRCRTGR